MNTTNRRLKRVVGRLLRKKTLIGVLLSLWGLAVAFFLNASFWNGRLCNEAFERALTRISADADDSFDKRGVFVPILTRSELNQSLADSALEYWNAYGAADANVGRTIVDGLLRWDVDRSTLKRLEEETGVSIDRGNTERERRNVGVVLESDYCATQEAFDVLAGWDDESADLEVAQDFLRELDGDDQNDQKTSDDLILWSFDARRGNPIDCAGVVTREDFERPAVIQTARRACDSSARLFFLITLGSLFFSRRESVLNGVLGVDRIRRELETYKAFWFVARRFVYLQTFCLLFLASRRRCWTFSFLPSTDSLSILSVVRLNN